MLRPIESRSRYSSGSPVHARSTPHGAAMRKGRLLWDKRLCDPGGFTVASAPLVITDKIRAAEGVGIRGFLAAFTSPLVTGWR